MARDHDPVLNSLKYGSQRHQHMPEKGADPCAPTTVHLALIIITNENPQSLRHQLKLKVVFGLHLVRQRANEPGQLLHLRLTFNFPHQQVLVTSADSVRKDAAISLHMLRHPLPFFYKLGTELFQYGWVSSQIHRVGTIADIERVRFTVHDAVVT